MRHEFAVEARCLFNFRPDEHKARLGRSGETAEQLSPAMSAIVIAGLSALSWAVLIAIVLSTRALF
jgi:hypothetical protein